LGEEHGFIKKRKDATERGIDELEKSAAGHDDDHQAVDITVSFGDFAWCSAIL
jgi:hypothetical protein